VKEGGYIKGNMDLFRVSWGRDDTNLCRFLMSKALRRRSVRVLRGLAQRSFGFWHIASSAPLAVRSVYLAIRSFSHASHAFSVQSGKTYLNLLRSHRTKASFIATPYRWCKNYVAFRSTTTYARIFPRSITIVESPTSRAFIVLHADGQWRV